VKPFKGFCVILIITVEAKSAKILKHCSGELLPSNLVSLAAIMLFMLFVPLTVESGLVFILRWRPNYGNPVECSTFHAETVVCYPIRDYLFHSRAQPSPVASKLPASLRMLVNWKKH
jgi:hypothetical protein